MKIKRLFILLAIVLLPSSALAEEEHTHDDGHSVREHEIHELTEMYITANPLNPSLLEHGSPASIIDEDTLIIRRSEPTIGATVDKELGVNSSFFGAGASRPIIRGNGGDRIRVLRNGIGTLDVANTSEDHAVAGSPFTAETVEVLRGPETLLFGNSAIGGVVNMTDNSIPEKPIGKPVTAEGEFRAGTGDDELTGFGKVEGQAGKFNWHVDAFYSDTDDYDIPGNAESDRLRAQEEAEGEAHEEGENNGRLANSAVRSRGFTAGGSYIWDRGFAGASFTGFDTRYGIPGHEHAHEDEHGHDEDEEHEGEEHAEHEGEEHEEDEMHAFEHEGVEHGHDEDEEHGHGEEEEEGGVLIELEQARADLRGRFDDVSDSIDSIKYKVAYADYEHMELEGDEIATSYENQGIEARADIVHSAIGDLEGVVGLQLAVNDLEVSGEEAFLPNTETFSPAIFAFEELSLDEYWRLQFGGRYEYVNHDPEGNSRRGLSPF